MAYETYGELNEERSNAILINHALTGDAHAANYLEGEKAPGWWDGMIGPGLAFDTEKYFVICSNVLGGCKGTTGPSSCNPQTQRPYGLDFPIVSIRDMVNVQKKLIEHLGVKKLLSVAGGSVGGMQSLDWVAAYPDLVASAILIATTWEHSPQQIAFNEAGRQAIMADPNWKDGNYYGSHLPEKGLSVARMIGHITYMSDQSMNEKFGRRTKDKKHPFKFGPEFEVENYLHYRGHGFTRRFDPNSYLYITKAADFFSLANEDAQKLFKNIQTKVLIVAFSGDWLYPPYQSKQIAKALKTRGVEVKTHVLRSHYGHDAFLVELEGQTRLYKRFLKKVSDTINTTFPPSIVKSFYG